MSNPVSDFGRRLIPLPKAYSKTIPPHQKKSDGKKINSDARENTDSAAQSELRALSMGLSGIYDSKPVQASSMRLGSHR